MAVRRQRRSLPCERVPEASNFGDDLVAGHHVSRAQVAVVAGPDDLHRPPLAGPSMLPPERSHAAAAGGVGAVARPRELASDVERGPLSAAVLQHPSTADCPVLTVSPTRMGAGVVFDHW